MTEFKLVHLFSNFVASAMELTGSSLSQYIMFSGDKLNIGGYQMK